MNQNREVIEPEIVKEEKEKVNFSTFDNFKQKSGDFAGDKFNRIKSKLIQQFVLYILVIGVFLILIIWAIVKLVSIIITSPFFTVFIILLLLIIIGHRVYWFLSKTKK